MNLAPLTDSSSHRAVTGRGQKILRAAVALSVSGVMTLTALVAGNAGVRAQTASVGTGEAGLAPATSVLYFGVSLDTTSAQWQIADGLLAQLGVDNGAQGLLDSMASNTTISGTDQQVDTSSLLGGEAAIVVTNLQGASAGASSVTGVLGGLALPSATGLDQAATAEAGSLSDAASAASGSVVIVKPGDLAAATKTVDDAMTSAASGMNVQVQSATYNGVTVKSYPGDTNTGNVGAAYAVVNGFLVLAETQADIEPVIDTAGGTTKPLSDVTEFGKADQALAGDRLGFGFINGSAMMSDAGSLDATTAGLMTSFGSLIGADQATGLSVVADPAGFRFNSVEYPYDGQPAQAGGKAADLSLAGKVPADSLLFVNGYGIGRGPLLQGLALYLVTTLDSAFNSTGAATPAAVSSPDELFANAGQLLGFNLKTDLIDQLVGEYGFAIWNADLNDPTQIGLLLASGTQTPAQVADSLSKLSVVLQAVGSGIVTVDSDSSSGSTITTVTIGDGSTSPAVTIDYGVVNDQFLLGLNDSVTQYTDGFANTLADAPEFKAGLAKLPTEYDGIYYVDLQKALTLSTSVSSAMGSSGGMLDNSSSCGNYASQAQAQAAYDADQVSNYDLDLDFDGQACEDYFAPATPVATPPASNQYAALRSFTMVSYKKDGLAYTSSILLIGNQ